jgi:type I restriction enzyme S subunit
MSFPRYEKYKDSGVEWLGALPAHWDVAPFKWQVERNDGGVWGDEPDGQGDTVVLRSTEQTVDGRWRMEDPATRKLTSGDREASLLAEGDLLVTKSSGSSLHIGKTTLVTPEIAAMGCCYSNFMQRIRLKPSFLPRLAWYVMNNDVARLQFDLLSNSTTGLANLNGTMIGAMVLPMPPTSEQAAIATFLDHETAKIDALVEEQKGLIELLKEKRQAVTSHAVTKGLNASAPMKDSGVEWLGEVPAHWEVRKVNSISTKITNGYVGPTRDILVDEGVRYLQSLHIKGNRIRFDVPYFVAEAWSHEHEKSILMTGDLLIVQTGDIGQAAVVTDEFVGCNCHALIIVAPLRDVVIGEYLGWVFNSDYGSHSLLAIQTGALHPHLNCGNVKDVFVPLPPKLEQLEIVGHCAAATSAFDELMSEAEAAVALLNERRAALISAAVTGKIDVRSSAAVATAGSPAC